MKDGDSEKYHASSVIQDFVFLSRKGGCIRCISLQVYNVISCAQALVSLKIKNYITKLFAGHIAQSVVSPIADPGVVSFILAPYFHEH